ncbi:Dihydrolipoyl dehydrogenase, Dihydrolipoamide dehydrogenase [Cupriavidus taiwanensis]|uniref:Dihydrolipoyl dehydrogenase, Dihydrolipoamide dehydrogenase n=1 Tax=Cupriavidus taiwanensis TaxID=164546 RepID=A0A975XAQ0_9BURK|nr:dihydrolipoyl dehydrogenase [Cupriavidus taiwanensis]SOY63988.1 Dihydrolipoyl dehydrogenase, Dihydrolipoamide dehydrogenase [Cupriavidus taiwanensis]
MTTIQTDVAVIGAGTAGLAAYRAAIAAGKRAVIIEGGPYGTTCARVGCMPSKLLIAAAEAAHELRHTAPFGVHVDGQVRIDGREVMARVRSERDRFVGFVVRGVENIAPADRIRGYARFIDTTTLEVDGHTTVRASRVVIATGSTPVLPAPFQVFGDRLIVNDDVFSWQDLPGSVVVFGPGVIGLELGQALSRLGVRVRVFGVSGSLGPLTDPVIRADAARTFNQEFYLDPDAKVTDMGRDGDQVVVTYLDREGRSVTERFDYALAATGRAPNVRGLALENTGLALDARGVPHFDAHTLQCGNAPVFIAGDANNILPLLHEAADEGKAAGENAASYPQVKPLARRAPIAVVFTDPQIAMVGQRYAELAARGEDGFVTGAVSFEDQGRSRVMLKNRGLMHLYADKTTGRFLGAEWTGPRAENIAHLLAWSYQQGLTIAQMLTMPFYHPVVEEGLRTALRDAAARLEG